MKLEWDLVDRILAFRVKLVLELAKRGEISLDEYLQMVDQHARDQREADLIRVSSRDLIEITDDNRVKLSRDGYILLQSLMLEQMRKQMVSNIH